MEFWLIKRPVRFFLGGVLIGLTFGFGKVLGRLVILPFLPDLFDVLLIAVAGLIFFYDSFRP